MNQIWIDAGHFDLDSGAIINGKKESEYTKEVRDCLKTLLIGYNVQYLSDTLDLKQTIQFINERCSSNDLAVSIHFNSHKDSSYRGTEAYYASSSRLAHIFAEQVSKSLGTMNRGARHDSLTYVGSLGFLRKLNCQSVVVECLYLTNESDRKILENGGIQKAAQGIVNAINIIFPKPEKEILKQLQAQVEALWKLFYNLLAKLKK